MTKLFTARAIMPGAALAALFLAPSGAARQPDRAPAAEPRLVPPIPKQRGIEFWSYQGGVTAVDATSITIRGLTWVINGGIAQTEEERYVDFALHRHTLRGDPQAPLNVIMPGREFQCRQAVITRNAATITDFDGEVTVIRRMDEPLRRFQVAQELAEGGFGTEWLTRGGNVAYRLTDVRVGDEVNLRKAREKGREVCGLIEIRRRPNGRVPAAPHEAVSLGGWPRHHEMMNVQQDWEAGIPIPERYQKYFAHFFPPETPVAPEPRLLPPRIPPAAP